MHKHKKVRPLEVIPGRNAETPSAKYNALSNFVRTNVEGATMCRMFCGGKRCKYENMDKWPKESQAIPGLFSHWVTSRILAMSRPVTGNIEKYKIIESFKREGINAIFNLQEFGEHATCGPGNEPSGFSYNPSDFQENGIFHYNFSWQDYGFGSLSFILDSVKVMQHAITNGKVAVHCHAGLGRTGVLIASYLVYANRLSAHEAVNHVREKRPGSVQTGGQVDCVEQFEKYLKPMRLIYSHVDEEDAEFTLSTFLARQQGMLHGYESRLLMFLPKVIFMCAERLLGIAGCGNLLGTYETDGYKFKIHRDNSTANGTAGDDMYISMTKNKSESSLREQDERDGRRTPFQGQSTSRGTTRHRPRGRDEEDVIHFEFASGDRSSSSQLEKERVVSALAQFKYDDDVEHLVSVYQRELNSDDHAWDKIPKESDAHVLAWLMFSWLDQLKEPLLPLQDIPALYTELCRTRSPSEALKALDKNSRFVLEYLMMLVVRLTADGSVREEEEGEMVRRILSTVTHLHIEDDLAYHRPSTSESFSSSISTTSSTSTISTTSTDGGHWNNLPRVYGRRLFKFVSYYIRMRRNEVK